MEILCSGILPDKNGTTWPCTKRVNTETGLHLIWTGHNQGHNCHFCSWKCLKGFIENSLWLKEEIDKEPEFSSGEAG